MSFKNISMFFIIFLSFHILLINSKLNPSNVEIAINCGGPEFRTKSGITYQKDRYFTGGEASDFGMNSEIKNTKDKDIYQTERWSTQDLIYEIPIEKEGKDYARKNFQLSLLEIWPMRTADETIINRESFWKNVLLTRGKFGYNSN